MEIINGLHVDVPGLELKGIMAGRLKYHQGKVEALEKQRAKLAEIDASFAQDAELIGKVTNSNAENLDGSIKRHRDNVTYYRFMVEHVVLDAVYRLTEHELQRLGMEPPGIWG